jgi:hypothetical protein
MSLFGRIILWVGIALGILDFITDIIYCSTTTFATSTLKSASVIFIIIQPLWYIFIYVIYMASHTEIESPKERLIKILLSPLYSAL